ncbi:hypothetical protein GCM10027517_14750 [Phycicoccus ginsengisoli]
MLVRALSAAGLRLAVVDGGGEEVLPFDPDAVRDNAGRRFPAHLDVAPPWPMPANRGNGQRFDRPAPRAWYSLRPSRAVDLARPDAAAAERASTDHPTSTALRALAARHRQRQVRPAPAFAPCSCDDECLLGPGCPAACPCQCEPAGGAAPHTVTP